ncbi:hypothetical protein MHTCC0001_29930 [Flavobacteriaceae bacterium MHTCC 0001]
MPLVRCLQNINPVSEAVDPIFDESPESIKPETITPWDGGIPINLSVLQT